MRIEPMNSVANQRPGIAIVGMDGRFPGARTLDQFWRNLCEGVETISFFSDEEVGAAGTVPPADPAHHIKARGVLEDADLFDAAFFGVRPREAELMDPQHRLFLESAWKALENAGCDPQRPGGGVGVFAGMSTNTYLTHNLGLAPQILIGFDGDLLAMIGNEKEFLPTRVSFKLDLKGPSLNIQTACSTSLVAVCVACQHLLTFQCDVALAGAVSVSFPQKRGYVHHEGGIESADGHCRPFDARSAGTVAGEGVGVVVLKRLADALAEGDAIYAVIRGFASNNDGALKAGYAAPSALGQSEVIALAQRVASFEPQTISYVEAHGTGTPVGDPVEVEGLSRAFRLGTDANQFCALGSVKGNIGHLDTAAGIAGLIKTALALHHKKLPPSLHFESPNPKIDFARSPFYVNAKLADWDGRGGLRRAGVSAFGIGGTNAHVVLEEAPAVGPPAPSRAAQLLLISARTPSALEAAAKNLAGHLRAQPQLPLADVAFTLQTGRRQFDQRAMLVCRNTADATGALESGTSKALLTGKPQRENPPIVFMFPGQGAQRLNMGRYLYETENRFRATVDQCCGLLEPHVGLDLRTVLYPKTEEVETATARLGQTAFTQPAIFVVEYALARLWMSWGVAPESMVGHSIGEYVAACLAGVFSLGDALRLVAARGRLMQELPGGMMLAVALSEREVTSVLNESLSLSAVNGPSACVVSGPSAAVEELQSELTQAGVACAALRTSHAFHSAMMEPVLPAFAALVQSLERRPPRMPIISNVTGTWITDREATDPAYWAGHLRHTVRFADGLGELLKGQRVFLEVGPGHTLSGLARQCSGQGAAAPMVSCLARAGNGASELETMLAALGVLWLNGVPPAWRDFYADEQRRRVWLPAYPFEPKRFWVEPGRPEVENQGTPASRAPDDGQNGSAHAGRNGSAPERAPESWPVSLPASRVAATEPDPPDESQSRVRLRNLVARMSGLDAGTLDPESPFPQMGFDSLFLAQVMIAMERDFGVRIPLRQLIEKFATLSLNSLARCIDDHRPAPVTPATPQNGNGRWSFDAAALNSRTPNPPTQPMVEYQGEWPERARLVAIQPKGARPPLVLVHGLGGGMLWGYAMLSKHLGLEQPVYALKSPQTELVCPVSIEEMAACYVGELRVLRPQGPYYLGGYCFGGTVAYEMARQLHAQRQQVALLALINCVPPNSSYDHPGLGLAFCAAFLRNLVYRFGDLPRLNGEQLREFLRRTLRSVKRKWPRVRPSETMTKEYNLEDFADVSTLSQAQRRLWETHLQAVRRYRPKAYAGHVTLLRTRGHSLVCSFDEAFGWRELARGGVTVHIVSGAHDTIMHEPHVRALAGELRPFLSTAASPRPSDCPAPAGALAEAGDAVQGGVLA